MAEFLGAGLVSRDPVQGSRGAVDPAPGTSNAAPSSDRNEHLAQELADGRRSALVAHGGHDFDPLHEPASAKVGEAAVGFRCVGIARATHTLGRYLLHRPE